MNVITRKSFVFVFDPNHSFFFDIVKPQLYSLACVSVCTTTVRERVHVKTENFVREGGACFRSHFTVRFFCKFLQLLSFE